MSAKFTITCPKCGTTTTVTTGVSKSGAGVGTCKKCHKTVRVHVDGKGDIIKVE